MKNYFMKILLVDYLDQVGAEPKVGRPMFKLNEQGFSCIGDFHCLVASQQVIVSIRNSNNAGIFPISQVWIEVPVIIDLKSSDI